MQAIVIPCIFTVAGLLGIFTAASAEAAYGKVLWNPIDIINLWMKSGSSSGRASAAFAAIGLIIVTLGINISANSISAANDLMSFCPRYINIRRGQLLAAFIGSWGFVPVSHVMMLKTHPSAAKRDSSGKFLLLRQSSWHS